MKLDSIYSLDVKKLKLNIIFDYLRWTELVRKRFLPIYKDCATKLVMLEQEERVVRGERLKSLVKAL